MFLAAPFVDEQFWGAPTLGGPEIRAALASSFAGLTVAVFTIPGITALFVETPLLALARRIGPRRLASAGFLAAGLGGLLAASSTGAVALALGLAITAPSAGCALALLQAAQMDADPARRERWMTRWTLAGSLGDLAAPVILGALLTFGLGWRAALVIVSLPFLVLGVAVRRLPAAAFTPASEEEEDTSLRSSLSRALRSPKLLPWTLGTILCDLLDEIVVIFSALHLRESLGATPAETAVAMALLPAGSALGLVLTDRLLRTVRPMSLLAIAAVPTGLAVVAFAFAPGPLAGIAALAVLGVVSAPLYPVARATAYRTLTEDSAAVAALDSLFTPVAMALPLAVAWVADAWGLRAAVLVLTAEPLGLLLLALLPRVRPPSGDPPR